MHRAVTGAHRVGGDACGLSQTGVFWANNADVHTFATEIFFSVLLISKSRTNLRRRLGIFRSGDRGVSLCRHVCREGLAWFCFSILLLDCGA